MTQLHVMEHRTCGHFGGMSASVDLLEAQVRVAAAAGYNQWGIRALADGEVDDAIATILAGPCSTCRMDESRGGLPAARAVAREELLAGRMPRTHVHFTDTTS